MTSANSGEDSPTELWLTRIDEYLTAIQQQDLSAQQRLLIEEPGLATWSTDLQEIDDFAGLIDEVTTAPDRPESASFGKYELRGELGRGGMGVVFRAYHSELDRFVALKMLTSSSLSTTEQRRRFTQEARLASRIRHPQIVTIHDVGELAGQPYFTMDLIEGTSLAAELRTRAVPMDQAVDWMIIIARAVEHLHVNGVIHRDLKPSNVLFDQAGKPCLVDFGLARALDELHDPTVTGTVLGTPSYMSPEQAAGRIREVTAQSDVYSLGAILYEILCGRPPFQADSPFDTVLQVLERDPLPLRHWNPSVPKNLEEICLRCLEKSADRRYRSAAELADDLERWQRGEIPAHTSGSLVVRFKRTVRRHPSAAYRLFGMIPSLLIILMRCVNAPETWSFYFPIIVELSLWIGLSLTWEWRSSKPHEQGWTDYAFPLTDITFLTLILQVQQKADVAPVAAYVLIILMAGLSLNRSLISATGIGCIGGFLFLVLQATETIAWHIALIIVILLACCTIVTDYQVRRLSIWVRTKRDPSSPSLQKRAS